MADVKIMSWDWREQPDLAELDRLVCDVSDGRVRIVPVITGSDQYAIAVSRGLILQSEADRAYRATWEGEASDDRS
jgi:hypothetical protein